MTLLLPPSARTSEPALLMNARLAPVHTETATVSNQKSGDCKHCSSVASTRSVHRKPSSASSCLESVACCCAWRSVRRCRVLFRVSIGTCTTWGTFQVKCDLLHGKEGWSAGNSSVQAQLMRTLLAPRARGSH